MLVLSGGELGKELGLDEVKKVDALLCYVRVQWEVGDLQPKRGPSLAPDHVGTLNSDFQPPELWEISEV